MHQHTILLGDNFKVPTFKINCSTVIRAYLLFIFSLQWLLKVIKQEVTSTSNSSGQKVKDTNVQFVPSSFVLRFKRHAATGFARVASSQLLNCK